MLDYHVHARYCRHAKGEIEDYVKDALQKGLKEIGFSDHYPMFYLPKLGYDNYSMKLEEFPSYRKDLEKTRKRFASKIKVKIGLEVDYYRKKEVLLSVLSKSFTSQGFDFIIGVVHVLDDWVIDDPRLLDKYSELNLDEFYSRYFKEVEALIKSGLFDIVGHIDVIKRFNILPKGGFEKYLEPCLDLIAKKDLCLEINTSGLARPIKDTYPGLNLLKSLNEKGIQVTVGSDAHDPKEVGRYFKKVLKALKKAGYSKVVSFKKREKVMRKI